MAWRYRLTQFARYFRAPPLTAADQQQLANHLTPELRTLFERMAPGEQAHSLRVMGWLVEHGHHQPELLQAALLHDVGKVLAPVNLIERGVIVLAQKFLPEAMERWENGEPQGWRRPFVTAACHAEWGAQLAAQAGAPPLTVHLIRQHQLPAPADPLLQILQMADNAS